MDGLPFDSIEKGPEDGTLTLGRKTEDEIIELQVKDYGRRLWMDVKILYGDNFRKCMEFDVVAFPNDHWPIQIRNVTMRY